MIQYRPFDYFIFRVINAEIFTKLFQIIVLLSLPLLCFGNSDDQKSYYVKPIDFVYDYPFNDATKWAVTCRVWGLLKYYHPNVTAGKLDWDQVLIERLDKIREADSPEQVNAELMQMIRIAGEYNSSKDVTWHDSLNMNVNLCWLDNSFIYDSIRQTLREIASQTVIQPSHYIKLEDGYRTTILNEKEYRGYIYDQYKYRLLSLFRFWNAVYYFFPYKYLMDQSWDLTLTEFIPHFINVFDQKSYFDAVNKLATRINDGHAYTSERSQCFSLESTSVTLIDSVTIIRLPPEGSLLMRGDIILSIDGKNIREIRDSIAALSPSSNKLSTDDHVNSCIYSMFFNKFELTILRNQQEISVRMDSSRYFSDIRKQLEDYFANTLPFHAISPDIGYVNLAVLKSSEILDIMDSLQQYRGVIFDLRKYPSHYSFREFNCHLSPTREYCYALAMESDLSHPGAFYKRECIINFSDELWKERKKYDGKMVVLINAETASAAETQAMSFRIFGATLIGTSTAGANGDVARFSLPGGITVGFSGLGFYYPDGTQMQRIGIIPDIEVYPTMDDILAGRDEVLEAAIKYLKSN